MASVKGTDSVWDAPYGHWRRFPRGFPHCGNQSLSPDERVRCGFPSRATQYSRWPIGSQARIARPEDPIFASPPGIVHVPRAGVSAVAKQPSRDASWVGGSTPMLFPLRWNRGACTLLHRLHPRHADRGCGSAEGARCSRSTSYLGPALYRQQAQASATQATHSARLGT